MRCSPIPRAGVAPALSLGLALAAAPFLVPAGAAQDAGEGDRRMEEGMDLLGEGMDLFLRGLMDEVRPQLERLRPELRDFASEMGPMLADLADLIDELDAYHPPERLPNGDIILRRKTPEEGAPEPSADPPGPGEIDI